MTVFKCSVLKRRENIRAGLLIFPPLLFLTVFYFYPLFGIFKISLFSEGKTDLSAIINVITKSYFANILWFTFWQAALSALFTLLFAVPAAYVFGKYDFHGKKLIQATAAIPFVMPTIVSAAAFKALFGTYGTLNGFLMNIFNLDSPFIDPDGTVGFIILAHIWINFIIVFRITGSFLSQMESGLTDAAIMLGASPFRAFRKVVLPLLLPALCASGILVFIFSFSSFGVVLILGGPRVSTIEVEIYRQAVHLYNLPFAACLSLIQILFTFAFMRFYTKIQSKISVPLDPEFKSVDAKRPKTLFSKIAVYFSAFSVLVFMGSPMAALAFQSICGEYGITIDHYRMLFDNSMDSVFFVSPVSAIFHSLGFASLTIVGALVLGLLTTSFLSLKKSKLAEILDPVFMLPLSTSAVTLGFGFIVTLDRPPLDLRTSIWLIPIAHTLVALPFAVRSLLPAFKSIPGHVREAASILGASPLRTWFAVDLMIGARAVAVAAVFAFTVSLGEFGATVFVARPGFSTMPLIIYEHLGRPGAANYGQAMAMSTLLMFVTALGFFIIEKMRTRVQEF